MHARSAQLSGSQPVSQYGWWITCLANIWMHKCIATEVSRWMSWRKSSLTLSRMIQLSKKSPKLKRQFSPITRRLLRWCSGRRNAGCLKSTLILTRFGSASTLKLNNWLPRRSSVGWQKSISISLEHAICSKINMFMKSLRQLERGDEATFLIDFCLVILSGKLMMLLHFWVRIKIIKNRIKWSSEHAITREFQSSICQGVYVKLCLFWQEFSVCRLNLKINKKSNFYKPLQQRRYYISGSDVMFYNSHQAHDFW